MLKEIIKERKKKLKALLKEGINPYPARVKRTISCAEALKNFVKLSQSKKKLSLAARIIGLRDQGNLIFADLKDDSAGIQAVLKKDNLPNFKILKENLDIGDFISASGTLFKTQKGEKSLEAKEIDIVSKSLRPLPDQWYGLKDVEERYRKRYLDVILNPEVKDRIVKSAEIIRYLREKLAKEGFIEVETPILQPLAGGALARPFITHHNALDCDFYLRISPELYLKRLLVAGFEKIFEIGRNFRNEGIDRDHNPEFTMLELYWAYQDYKGLMEFIKKVLSRWIPGNWKTTAFCDLIKKSPDEIKEMKTEKLDALYREERDKITEPAFIVDYPEKIMPLAKFKEENRAFTESFQLIADGAELMKGFSEMNDPEDQREQMERQEKEFRGGNEEASRLDEDFLEALEYGMPPAAGLGIGIDRLVAFITKSKSLKETIIFPTLKPKG